MALFPRKLWPWLRDRLFPHGTDMIHWASYVIILGIIVYHAVTPGDARPYQFNTTMLALVALLVINILWEDLKARFSSEQTGQGALLLISTGLAFYAIIVGRLFNGIYLIFMIVAQANAMLPLAPALAFSALLTGSFLSVMVFSFGASLPELRNIAAGLAVGLTFTITLSQVLNRYIEQSDQMKRLLEELQEANLALMEAREKEKDLVIAEERLRMARDLHDGLGHHLTALSIQLQAAEKLLRSNPEMAGEAVRSSRSEVQAALKEVRQSVAALREAPVDMMNLPSAIEKLVAETGQRSGIGAHFLQHGNTAALAPAAAMTIYRAAQEGLTNVQKHAGEASEVRVRLEYRIDCISLVVENDGPAGSGQQAETGREGTSGFGLAGLRERAVLLGGSLECGPRPGGGFRLELRIPPGGAVHSSKSAAAREQP